MQEFLYVRREKKYEHLKFDEIIYVKGKVTHIQIVTEQRTCLVMNSLTAIAKHLPPDQFCRIHHSYIVALARVKAFDRTTVELHEAPEGKPFRAGLAREKTLPVGLKYRAGFRGSVKIMQNKSGTPPKKLRTDCE